MRSFEAVEELADEDWGAIRADLLDPLRTERPRGRRAARAAEVFLRGCLGYAELAENTQRFTRRSEE